LDGAYSLISNHPHTGMRLAMSPAHQRGLYDDGKHGITFDEINVPYPAKVLDALPNAPGHLLIETINANGGVIVHRIDAHASAGLLAYHLSPSFRIDRGGR
jgi:hypothetical protein